MNFNESFCECGDKCYTLSSSYWTESTYTKNCKYRFHRIYKNRFFQYKNFNDKISIIIENNTYKVYFIYLNKSTELEIKYTDEYENINNLIKFCDSVLENLIFT